MTAQLSVSFKFYHGFTLCMYVLSKFIQTSFSHVHTYLSFHFYLIHPHMNVNICTSECKALWGEPKKAPSFSIGWHTRVFAWDPLLHKNWLAEFRLTEHRRPEHLVCHIITVLCALCSMTRVLSTVKVFLLFWGVCTCLYTAPQSIAFLPCLQSLLSWTPIDQSWETPPNLPFEVARVVAIDK